MPPLPLSTSVTITNPLVLYRSLVATNRIDPDPAQLRLAIHLQKLYDRLKDYEPIVEYGHRLNQISKALGKQPSSLSNSSSLHGQDSLTGTKSSGVLASLFEQRREKDSLALTRILTSHEAALELDSPKGLMLHGEVGTGKSMLIDLFADCLPNKKKKRWHFSTFMLDVTSKLEQLRRSRQTIIPSSLGVQDEYSLLWLARDMISTSPILFIDEFQLPDRAASKIMTNLMTGFFHLGGVLIATSNRIPEELAKAAGVEFTPPPSRLGALRWGLNKAPTSQRGHPDGTQDFAAFLEVLKARCEIWEIEGRKDYRRREMAVRNQTIAAESSEKSLHGFQGLQDLSTGNIGLGFEQSLPERLQEGKDTGEAHSLPSNYIVGSSVDEAFKALGVQLNDVTKNPKTNLQDLAWKEESVTVYGRTVTVPRQYSGATMWTFEELCGQSLGPADYVTLASTFHTFILIDVPILTILQKNEARRFITLLDALYEARCKLAIHAAAGPDNLFFPEPRMPTHSVSGASATQKGEQKEVVSQDAVYSETMSEVYQDATAPFRPNITMYEDTNSFSSEPDYTHSRLAGIFSDDQLEDTPPNHIRRGDRVYSHDRTQAEIEAAQALHTRRSGPDFSKAGIFTGEDEKFAYKRARSRLWEMCGAKWWERTEEGWWQPVHSSVRSWENPAESRYDQKAMQSIASHASEESTTPVEGMGSSRSVNEEQDEVLYRHGASPFRNSAEPPPKFQWTHFWGMMTWGKKAGAWGQGVDGLKDRPGSRQESRKPEQ